MLQGRSRRATDKAAGFALRCGQAAEAPVLSGAQASVAAQGVKSAVKLINKKRPSRNERVQGAVYS